LERIIVGTTSKTTNDGSGGGPGEFELNFPHDAAIDRNNGPYLYVGQQEGVEKLTIDGTTHVAFFSKGCEEASGCTVHGVAVDPDDGSVYASYPELQPPRVVKYDGGSKSNGGGDLVTTWAKQQWHDIRWK
jgi:hypothetical protein